MKTRTAAPTRDQIAQAKLLYDAGVAPIAEILKVLGMSAGQFRRYREQNGWPLRASACAPKNAAKTAPPTAAKPARLDGGLIARIEDAVEREFARAEAALEKHTPKTIEASARTLASLVKTLAELKRMRREANDAKDGDRDDDADDELSSPDAPPRELAELRAELARRLERLRGERPTE